VRRSSCAGLVPGLSSEMKKKMGLIVAFVARPETQSEMEFQSFFSSFYSKSKQIQFQYIFFISNNHQGIGSLGVYWYDSSLLYE